jgi:hypothetical protein
VIEEVRRGIRCPACARDDRGSLDLRSDHLVGNIRREREVPPALLGLVDDPSDRRMDAMTVRPRCVGVDRRSVQRVGEPHLATGDPSHPRSLGDIHRLVERLLADDDAHERYGRTGHRGRDEQRFPALVRQAGEPSTHQVVAEGLRHGE